MLPILDIIHRGVVYSLVGLTIYAGVGIVSTHNNTMRAGRGARSVLPLLLQKTLMVLFQRSVLPSK